jgi:hypothetical protein
MCHVHSNDLKISALVAADEALKSAAETGDKTSDEVDKKFEEAIHILSTFEDFRSKDLMSDPNTSRMVTREAMSDKFKSPSAIISALKENLHAKVRLYLSLTSRC